MSGSLPAVEGYGHRYVLLGLQNYLLRLNHSRSSMLSSSRSYVGLVIKAGTLCVEGRLQGSIDIWRSRYRFLKIDLRRCHSDSDSIWAAVGDKPAVKQMIGCRSKDTESGRLSLRRVSDQRLLGFLLICINAERISAVKMLAFMLAIGVTLSVLPRLKPK